MASYNRVILMGNLTRDPELRYTAGQTAVSDVGLAVNDRRKGNDGQWIEETTFVEVTLWGRTAEVAGEYLSKGSPVLIEGRLKLDTWENKEGEKRSKLHVVCERMQMLGSKGGGGGGGERSGGSRASVGSESGRGRRSESANGGNSGGYGGGGGGGGYGGGDDAGNDEDIPF